MHLVEPILANEKELEEDFGVWCFCADGETAKKGIR